MLKYKGIFSFPRLQKKIKEWTGGGGGEVGGWGMRDAKEIGGGGGLL